MAMPMRLVVMLHRRRSARAGSAANSITTATVMPSTSDPPRLTAARARRARSRASADKQNTAVIDVGACRPGRDEVVQSPEKFCRIVVIEAGARIKTELFGPRKGRFIDAGAGRVAGCPAAAIGAVR